MELLELGTPVATKNGDGVILKVDMVTYDIPMYHVLLIDSEYADEIVYISDPRISPEINQPMDRMSDDELNTIRTELEFDTMRNLITGTVTCRQCSTQYREIGDTEIVDIEADTPAFYCTKCGERLIIMIEYKDVMVIYDNAEPVTTSDGRGPGFRGCLNDFDSAEISAIDKVRPVHVIHMETVRG